MPQQVPIYTPGWREAIVIISIFAHLQTQPTSLVQRIIASPCDTGTQLQQLFTTMILPIIFYACQTFNCTFSGKNKKRPQNVVKREKQTICIEDIADQCILHYAEKVMADGHHPLASYFCRAPSRRFYCQGAEMSESEDRSLFMPQIC